MELKVEHIEIIRNDLLHQGVTFDELADSLLDHICCLLESSELNDFNIAYSEVLKSFGEEGLGNIQRNTYFLLIHKQQIIMKKTMYSLGYLASFLSIMGLLFKLQHWPGASVMLVVGIAVLNFGFLPMYFYDRYKKSIRA